MSQNLAIMNREQLEQALAPTEGLSHSDVEFGPDKGLSFKESSEGAAVLVLKDQELQMTTNGVLEAARGVHLPKSFSDFAPQELLLHNLNYLYSHSAGKLRFYIQHGVVVGAAASKTRYYSNQQMVEAAEQIIGRDNVLGYHQVQTSLDYSRVAVVTNRSFDVTENDTLYGGITFQNSIVGEQKIQIAPYIFRQWCSNGAFVSENVSEWSHRNDGNIDINEWVRNGTDMGLKALDNEFRRIQKLTETLVDGHSVEALRSLFIKFGIPVRTQEAVLAAAADQNGGQGPRTMYDIWNAFTYVATHSKQIATTGRNLLQDVAGQITRQVDLCPHCHQLMEIKKVEN